jgi:diguanylate cyclase (GGDEF)-like protein
MDGSPPARILVADDDPDIRELITRVLELAGYDVVAVSSGTAVLEAVPREHPDLCVLDVSMPGATGYDVCRQLQRAGADAPPVIFLTARGSTSDRVTGLDLGAVDYMVKPFEPPELTARVRAALRQKATRDALAAEAATDGLTGLLNRRELDTRAVELIALSRRYARPLSCLMVDIDHFKDVNDTHGHAAGDDVLREVAARIRGAGRTSDIAARYGGEEFVLLLPDTDARGAVALAEKLRTAIAATPVVVASHTPKSGGAAGTASTAGNGDGAQGALAIPVRVSIGVASRGAAMLDPEALYAGADAALYQAKQTGRDRVAVAPPSGGFV